MTHLYRRTGSGPGRWSRRVWYSTCAERWETRVRVPRAVLEIEHTNPVGPLDVAFDTMAKTARVRL
jgi:hypothetical protein